MYFSEDSKKESTLENDVWRGAEEHEEELCIVADNLKHVNEGENMGKFILSKNT